MRNLSEPSQSGVMKTLTVLAVIFATIPAANASEVAPAIHELCLKAVDYAGCVRAQSGEPDEPAYSGNKCPANHAYIGDGKCQRVYCDWVGLGGGHHEPLVAGKSTWRCGNNYNFWKDELQVGVLRLGATVNVEQSNDCPSVGPKIGWKSSCEHAAKNWRAVEAEAKRPKCADKLQPYECSYSSYLDANPGMKQWAELNPAMAEKERLRLESDPLNR